MVPIRDTNKEINAADIEHIGALVSGGLMVMKGFRRGGPVGLLYKAAGLGLLYRGQKGYRRLYSAMGLCLKDEPTGVGKQNAKVDCSIVIDRPREELFRIWRNLENLPVFMNHLISVHEVDDTRSLWVARAPAGTVIKWEAEIINVVENELIAWSSLEGSGVDSVGSVHFEDVPGGTRVHVVLRYDPPGDMLGIWIAKIFQSDPQTQIYQDLKRFKAIMEIGGEGKTIAPTEELSQAVTRARKVRAM